MKKNVMLLVGIIVLYLAPSLVLEAVYGPSYGFLAGEDCWVSDDNGGWVKHGNPASPMPTSPSVHVPMVVRYIPIFLPAALLIVFYLTPLSKKMETPTEPDQAEPPGEQPPDSPRDDEK